MVDAMEPGVNCRPTTNRPLHGLRVCCAMRSGSPAYNARFIKVAEAAADAGADVVLVVATASDAELPACPFPTVVVPVTASSHRVWAVRVITNLYNELLGEHLRLEAAARRVNADLYHAHFLPTLPALVVAARRVHARVLYDPRDLFVDAARATWPVWKTRYYRWLERRFVTRADAVLAVSRPMARVLKERYGIADPTVIMNGPYDRVNHARPVSRPVRLLFQGAFRHNRNLPSLVRAMAALRGKAILTLQGWGDMEEDLRALVSARELDGTVVFRAPCAPRDVVACAAEHDVGVVAYKADTLNLEVAVPNKLLDYVGAGLAIAASDLPGHRSVLDGADFGVLIDPSSDETLARALARIVDDPDRIARMKQGAVRAASGLSWTAQSKRLIDVYTGLVTGRG